MESGHSDTQFLCYLSTIPSQHVFISVTGFLDDGDVGEIPRRPLNGSHHAPPAERVPHRLVIKLKKPKRSHTFNKKKLIIYFKKEKLKKEEEEREIKRGASYEDFSCKKPSTRSSPSDLQRRQWEKCEIIQRTGL